MCLQGTWTDGRTGWFLYTPPKLPVYSVHITTYVFLIWILLMMIQHYVINFVYVTNDHRYVPLVVSTCRFFSRSWLITRVTRQVSLVDQELPTLLEHLSSLPVFREVHVARSLVFCVMFCRSLFVLMSFIFWSLCCLVLLRFTDSDYPFGIFKFFLSVISAGRWFSLGT